MNFDFDIVMVLALFTIGFALLWGIMSWQRARKAQDHHEDAAVAKRQRTEDSPADSDDRPAGRTWSAERGANPPTPEHPTPMPPRN